MQARLFVKYLVRYKKNVCYTEISVIHNLPHTKNLSFAENMFSLVVSRAV